MKKNLSVFLLLSSFFVQSAEKQPEAPQRWIDKMVPLRVKKLVRSTVNTVNNFLPGTETVEIPVEEDYDLVAPVSATSIKDLSKIINKLNQAVKDHSERLASTITSSQTTIDQLNSNLSSMREILQNKNKENTDLKKQLVFSSTATPAHLTADALQDEVSSDEQDSFAFEKEYQAAMLSKINLEEKLNQLQKQNTELTQQVHAISRHANQTERAKETLENRLMTIQEQQQEDEAVCSSLLQQTQEDYRALGIQHELCMQEKSLVIMTLETILKEGAQTQETEYNKAFAQTFLQAFKLSADEVSTITYLLFPPATSYVNDNLEEIFEA